MRIIAKAFGGHFEWRHLVPKISKIVKSQIDFEENKIDFVCSTESADGQATLNTRTSAGTVVALDVRTRTWRDIICSEWGQIFLRQSLFILEDSKYTKVGLFQDGCVHHQRHELKNNWTT